MSNELPLILAGPLLRKTTPNEIVFWLTTSKPLQGEFHLYDDTNSMPIYQAPLAKCQQIKVGEHAYVVLAQFKSEFPQDQALSYDFVTPHGGLSELVPDLTYQDEQRPTFKISTKADYILHGSCRNPHHFSEDALVTADRKVEAQSILERPDLLMMSGDQIYADHVAGPTLDAIEQAIELLGMPNEVLPNAPVPDSASLYAHPDCYFGRDKILPHDASNESLLGKWLPSRRRPIFSSRESENHLISFAEFFVMYLLVWSPTLWRYIDAKRIPNQSYQIAGTTLPLKWQQQWQKEAPIIDNFVQGLGNVQRLMAHVPTYMVFDDHDVTDDWNLTIGWEKAAYGNPFAHRIIGNGLMSYWLCQGWGNEPDNFNQEFLDLAYNSITTLEPKAQDDFVQHLYKFEQWHYTIHTSPKVVVLDTRTRRWRSESKMNKPSGLMDWEALIEFQQELMHQDKVIVVSAAPMFGVKFIEALQRGMTWAGQPLLIDAENWMAHPGSANTLLSIFTHTKTPTNFVILSGDVHYSFAYDIKLRFRRNSPNIYQITCSGFKNQFPEPLISICDIMDRMLYSPRSFLNLFTKRKRLRITKREPEFAGAKRLVNQSAIGELKLDDHGKPSEISILTASGKVIGFLPTDSD
ncbi:alkaline phosphatase D family protein [Vibrio paucivorans]